MQNNWQKAIVKRSMSHRTIITTNLAWVGHGLYYRIHSTSKYSDPATAQ